MRKFLLALALVLAAGAAQADNGTFYVGAGISRDNLKDITATASDLNSTDWKIWAGFRPISVFAVEADYLDLGSQTVNNAVTSTHVDYKAFAGYAVGFVPIPVPYLDVFGKAGLARWTSSGGSSFPGGPFFSLSDEGTEFAWGLGTQVHVGNFGARLEYENFSIRNTNGANIVSLSVFLNLF
ncbi:MAG TPA: outer membrane beta-barrel protein [Steroidobacteraceae bacterium]|nr:outer membrane beta-barrel protein [Steroidobacteraceae bacterium]